MAQSKPRVALTVTRSLAKAKQRWAKAWVQVKGGIWCFEDEREARSHQPGAFSELFVEHEPGRPKGNPCTLDSSPNRAHRGSGA